MKRFSWKCLATRLAIAATAIGCLCPDLAPAAEHAPTKPSSDLNRPFKKKQLDVEQWLKRFERPDREVYHQRERIVSAMHLHPGMRVADIGAGTGFFTLLFARAVGPRGRVYAVDISPGFLDYIQQRARKAGLTNIVTVRGSDRSVNLPKGSVDVAFICDTYHHFEQPQAMLTSIAQALKPGGALFLIEFHRIPGKSSQWILNHVRAGEEVFTREIEAAGFRKVESYDLLKANYMIRFERNKR